MRGERRFSRLPEKGDKLLTFVFQGCQAPGQHFRVCAGVWLFGARHLARGGVALGGPEDGVFDEALPVGIQVGLLVVAALEDDDAVRL